MRIALFAWDSLDSIFVGGAGIHVSELGRALAALGHEVHLFTRLCGWPGPLRTGGRHFLASVRFRSRR